MEKHQSAWKTLSQNGKTSVSMENPQSPWKTLSQHGKPSVGMENPQSAWKNIRQYGKTYFNEHRQLLVAFIFQFVPREVTHWVAD
jgi:hypothetical protein